MSTLTTAVRTEPQPTPELPAFRGTPTILVVSVQFPASENRPPQVLDLVNADVRISRRADLGSMVIDLMTRIPLGLPGVATLAEIAALPSFQLEFSYQKPVEGTVLRSETLAVSTTAQGASSSYSRSSGPDPHVAMENLTITVPLG